VSRIINDNTIRGSESVFDSGRRLGFTGTQWGMTEIQKQEFERFVIEQNPLEFHHGDCIGSDAEAHEIVRRVLPLCVIVIHPPSNDIKRAFKKGDESRPPAPYLTRNHNIIQETDFLVATPVNKEVLRSGTWATVRWYRRWKKSEPKIIYPWGV